MLGFCLGSQAHRMSGGVPRACLPCTAGVLFCRRAPTQVVVPAVPAAPRERHQPAHLRLRRLKVPPLPPTSAPLWAACWAGWVSWCSGGCWCCLDSCLCALDAIGVLLVPAGVQPVLLLAQQNCKLLRPLQNAATDSATVPSQELCAPSYAPPQPPWPSLRTSHCALARASFAASVSPGRRRVLAPDTLIQPWRAGGPTGPARRPATAPLAAPPAAYCSTQPFRGQSGR